MMDACPFKRNFPAKLRQPKSPGRSGPHFPRRIVFKGQLGYFIPTTLKRLTFLPYDKKMKIKTFFWTVTTLFVFAGCQQTFITPGTAADLNPDNKILKTGRQMTLVDKLILVGGCWDYANAVYTRAGYPPAKRKIIFESDKAKGPYADLSMVQPGDWLYFINDQYGNIEHSAIFIDWIDFDSGRGLMLSYGGEHRRAPARYLSYDLSQTYVIVRPREK